jgi:ubiquinone/menaquinone biosynthesis C-methylase UbiE
MYTDRTAREYRRNRFRTLDQRIVDHAERRALARLIRCRLKAGDRALDVPSGYGRFAEILSSEGIWTVHADRSTAMLRLGLQDEFQEGSPVIADVRSLPFRSDAFDLVMSVRMLQHLDPEGSRAALSELTRVCRRTLVLTFYAPTFLHRLQRRLSGRKRLNLMRFEEVKSRVKGAGMRVRLSRKLLPFYHAQSVAVFEKIP